ncbi:DUF6264 family protein [Curtobacterium sp. RRHDQ10]|uniref:DUF6264 family protein n=1 Tax=Curtobacterium phyllosphaerae TaxID=3413379 RepID=UPI003BF3D112
MTDHHDGREARPGSVPEVPLPQFPPPTPVQRAPPQQRPDTLSADGRPIGRPAPQYGEYAPEGWVNPVIADRERRERDAAARRRELAALEAARAQQGRSGPPVRNPAGPTTGPGAPDGRGGRPGAARMGFGASPGDLMATVLLLVLGTTTVLQQAVGVRQLAAEVAQQLARRSIALSDPGALVGAASWSAVIGVVLLVGALVWSVLRLRRGRVTFWVPLAAGALASVVSALIYVVVAMHDPAFVASVAQNGGAG